MKIVSVLGRDAMILESSNAVHTIGLRCAVHTLRIGDQIGKQDLAVRPSGETRQSRQLHTLRIQASISFESLHGLKMAVSCALVANTTTKSMKQWMERL